MEHLCIMLILTTLPVLFNSTTFMKTLFFLFPVLLCFWLDGRAQELRPPPPTPAPEIKPTVDEEYKSFAYVEVMPEFKGGQAEMYKFMTDNIYMPDSCKEMGVAGTVAVQFVVDSMGYVRNSKVVRNTSIDCGYGEIALEMLEKMNHPEPHWIAGRHNGKRVNVSYTLPVKFKFSD